MEGLTVLARVTVFGLLAITTLWACAGQSADSDDRAGGDGGGGRGGSSASGGGGRGGSGASTGGRTASGGSGATAAVGAIGATGPGYCTPTPVTCTLPGGFSSAYPAPYGAPCETENNFCEGTYCNDSYSSSGVALMCCHGVWTGEFDLVDGVRTCKGPPEPGELFLCESGMGFCTAGETYCDDHSSFGDAGSSLGCPALCAAGDCSCFCTPDPTGACSFELNEFAHISSNCTCRWWESSMVPVPGTGIQVSCVDVIVPDPGPCEIYPDLEDECRDRGVGYMCNGPDLPQPSGCASLGSVGSFTGYCCQ